MRVLLVDDDAGLRALLRTTFDVFDIDVDEAAGAAEARELIRADPPDVIVLDVVMPGMDGLEFCRELKSNGETRGIAVVLLSGSEGGSRVAADAAGAEAFVPKPFSPLELLAVVERLSGGLYGVPFRATKKSRQRGGAAAPLRARPAPPAPDRARATLARAGGLPRRPSPRSPARWSRRTRARARTPSACSATRSSSRARWTRSSRTIRRPSTGSCCTTSARSGSPTACSRSPHRSPSRSGR